MWGIPYETDLVALESQLPAVLNVIYESEKETMNSAPRYLGVQTLADSAVVLRFAADVREESIFAAQRRLVYFCRRRCGCDAAHHHLFEPESVGCTQHAAHVVQRAHVVEHHDQRQLPRLLEIVHLQAVQILHSQFSHSLSF